MIRKQNLPGITPDMLPDSPPPAKVDKGKQAFALTQEQPKDARKRKSYPYYSEVYAREAKIILDKLHTGGVPLRIPCGELSVVTASLQYYQGSEYLRDHDESGKYTQLFQATKCMRENGFLEFRIRQRRKLLTESLTTAAPWREDFLEFLDKSQEGEKFHRTDVTLTDEDIAWFNNQCAPLEQLFIFNASHNEILVVRHTEGK